MFHSDLHLHFYLTKQILSTTDKYDSYFLFETIYRKDDLVCDISMSYQARY